MDLSRADQAFRSGDLVAGVTHLRRLLDRPVDSFVPSDGRTGGARAAVEALLLSQPPGVRQFYESAENAAAEAAFRLAGESEDPAALRRVAHRFPSTEPGFRATDRLAVAAFDQGDFATAARLWEGLISDPRHANRVTPAVTSRLVVALRHAGRDGRASELALRYSSMPLRIAGKAATVGSLLASVGPAAVPLPATGEPATAGGSLAAPAFPPGWALGNGPAEARLAELWAGSRRAEGRPVAAAAGAVWVSDRIVLRDPSGIAAVDARSGHLLWSQPLAASAPPADGAEGDLHDLTRFEAGYASGGVYGRLSADAERVYVVDRATLAVPEVRTASSGLAPAYDLQPSGDPTNRLIALPIESGPAGPRPAWVVGGPREEGRPLADHFFFGPPCVTPDGLLTVAEHRQCLTLLALDPATGRERWRQPLGYVPRPVSSDPGRAAAACAPAVSEGIAVCSTNAGFVVAFDFVAGRLLWAYDYAAAEPDARRAHDGAADRNACYGDAAFPCPAVIRQGRVVLMPHDSRMVHCLDLRTGAVRWAAPREDGLYVACVTDDAVVVVGRSFCRSLSIAGGSPRWSARFGTPAGTGVATEGAYLLPVEDGRIVAVDLVRGCRIGFDVPRSAQGFRPLDADAEDSVFAARWRPGNLFTDGRSLLSVGPGGVTRFRTAEERLAAEPVLEDPIDTARTELADGRLDAAERRLVALAGDGPDAAEHEQERGLLRELHYVRLDRQGPGDGGDSLAALDDLSRTPRDRGRFLLRAAEYDIASGDAASLRRRAAELAALDLAGPLPVPQDETLLVTPASWAPALLRRGLDAGGEGGEPSDAPADAAFASGSTPDLERRLLFLDSEAEAAAVRRELARRAFSDGEFQRAELWLLQNLERGACAASAGAIDELRCVCGLTAGGGGGGGKADVAGGVNVTGRLWAPADEAVCRAYGGMRRGFLTRGRDPFRIVDRGDNRQSRLAVVDLDGGVCLGEVSVDARLRFPLLSRQPADGHFVPVAAVGRLHGLSLLEVGRGEPMWTAELGSADGLLPQVGPYGPSFCTVQTRRELAVLDPISGSVLWRRTELPPDRGLHGNQAAGLFGDSRTLTMLDADGAAYTTYRTKTGEEYARGRLPIDRQQQPSPRAYGRKLFFVEPGEGASVARLWDPAADCYDLAERFEGRLLQTSTRDDELVLLFPDGRLLIFDAEAGAAVVDVKLPPGAEKSEPHTVGVFSDDERYYVSLHHSDPRRFEEPKVASFVYDSPLSAAPVQGRLVAIDRRSGAAVWSRAIDQRSVLDPVDHPAPFLVAFAKVTDRRFGNRKTLLVEAIDKRTGATLGGNDALVPDLPLQMRAADGRVELAGMTSTVVLDFVAATARDATAFEVR